MGDRIFISYSHDSPEHMARVRRLQERVRQLGFDCRLDQLEAAPPEGWWRWCKNQIRLADFVLVVCTGDYHMRFDGFGDGVNGNGTIFEANLIAQALYDWGGQNTKFIPVYFDPEDHKHIPEELRSYTRYAVHEGPGNEFEKLVKYLRSAAFEQTQMYGALTPEFRERFSVGEVATPVGSCFPSLGRRAWLLPVLVTVVLVGGAVSPKRLPPSGKPQVEITEVPPVGIGGPDKLGRVCGKTSGVLPSSVRIVLFAISDRAYVQPYASNVYTMLDKNGEWCNYTHYGSSYAALLVTPDFRPPDVADALPQVGDKIIASTVAPGSDDIHTGQ